MHPLRLMTSNLPHTVILYQGKPCLQINAIKPSYHHDCGRMRVVSKVLPFLHSFCIENNGKGFSFDIKIKIKNICHREFIDFSIFDVPIHDP